uniref:lipoyl(octanoyl) transferase n=1 Tax=Heterorhabditis bacteriophora TaxID=37862 RepID=A0A1I7XRN4_HETBA
MLRSSFIFIARQFSSKPEKTLERKVVVCANGVIAAWHPPQQFPYEYSRPVELKQEKIHKKESPLSDIVDRKTRLLRAPANVELKNIFYTDKHEWFTRNYLIAVEHPPVYTVGIRSKLYSTEEEKRLKDTGADFHRTSRGGLITFHGPGQLVLYPIFDLRRISRKPLGVRRFVELLEQVIIDCASNDFNLLEVGRTKHTGVWVGTNRKLAALGIAVSHGVSYHGLAVNCNTDLSWFDHVVGCGIEGAVATSLSKECNMNISLEDVLPHMQSNNRKRVWMKGKAIEKG